MEPREEHGVDSLSALAAMAAEERTGSRRMRLALAAAVGVHLVLFAVHWPTFASGVAEAEVEKPKIFVLKIHRVVPPEERPFEVPPLPQKKVSIPDATPDGPEPLVRPEDVSESSFLVDPQLIFNPGPPPDPDPPPRGPVRVFQDIEPPAKVFAPNPVYPKAALAARLQGMVVLECLIGRDGRVADVEVLRPAPLGLTEAAVEAVRQWRFEPSTVDEAPVEVLYILTVRFTLPRG